MAEIIGGLTTSHIPAVGNAISDGVTREYYWKRFFDGYAPVHEWLKEKRPDAIIVVYNDHGLNFFLDKMPSFAIGCADLYENADEGWGLKPTAPFPGDAAFSWHLAESLINREFDMCTCQEMLVDHGFVNPMRVLFGDHQEWPIRSVPLVVNTVQHPLVSAKRCLKLGKALKSAVDSYPEDLKVVVAGTGGMSHQLQGERAGFINVDYDLACIDSIINNPDWFADQPVHEIVRQAGTEGIETIMWLVMRGALGDRVNCLHKHYHAPVSNTGAGVLLLESAA